MKIFDQLAKQFEKDHPNVKVSLEMIPGSSYNEKLQVQFASGTAPDVITIAPQYWPDYVRAGLLENLEPYIQKDDMFKGGDPIVSTLWKTSTYNRDRYGIPGYFATQVFYYNKTLFKKAGLATPNDHLARGDWTWKTMADLAKKLTVKDARDVVSQYGFRMAFAWWGSYMPDLWMNGAAFLGEDKGSDWSRSTLNTKAVAEVFESYLELIDAKVAPNPIILSTGDAPVGFETGRVAMSWDGDWWIGAYAQQKALDWDLAPLPSRKTRMSVLYTDSYNINKRSKHKKEAWEFLKLVAMSEEGQLTVGNAGLRGPSLRKLVFDPGLQKKWVNPAIYPEHYLPVIQENLTNSDTPPYRTKWSRIETEALTPTLQKRCS
ncbi:MAG: sugar ABC transporter substrate-binding protein [Firmicutes bacterium]|nr:sugar ABC transporter substrate-binding protein [Bacillota bacterium]